ncbi:MAG: hypothetical protein V3S43_06340 [Acidimicrobiia bacterium]
MTSKLVLATVLLVLSFTTGGAHVPNLLVDRSFEDNDPAWVFVFNAKRTNVDGAKTGVFSASFEKIGGVGAVAQQAVTETTDAGDVIFASTWIKRKTALAPDYSILIEEGGTEIGSVRVTAAGELFFTRGVFGVDPEVEAAFTIDPTDFAFVQATGTTAGGTTLSITIGVGNLGDDGEWIVDDAYIADEPANEVFLVMPETGQDKPPHTFARWPVDPLTGMMIREDRTAVDRDRRVREASTIEDLDHDDFLDFPPRSEEDPPEP